MNKLFGFFALSFFFMVSVFAHEGLQRQEYCVASDPTDRTVVTVVLDQSLGLTLAIVARRADEQKPVEHLLTVPVEFNAIPGSLLYSGRNLELGIALTSGARPGPRHGTLRIAKARNPKPVTCE